MQPMTQSETQPRGPGEPSAWVARFIGGVRRGGRVLDVACGGGRHLRLALAHGLEAVGIDRDVANLGDLAGRAGLTLIAADLEDGRPFPLRDRRYDGVIVTNYLWRPILADIVACVAADGVLIYETFACGQQRFGRPTHPDHLLRANELIEAALPHLVVVAFEHGLIEGRRVVQRIAACGPSHPWARAEAAIPPPQAHTQT